MSVSFLRLQSEGAGLVAVNGKGEQRALAHGHMSKKWTSSIDFREFLHQYNDAI